jgi:outer membrane autotransporter protein
MDNSFVVENGGELNTWGDHGFGLVKDVLVQGVKAWDITENGGIGGFVFFRDKESNLESGTVDLGGGLVVGDLATADTVTVRNGGKLVARNGGKVKDLTVEGNKAWDTTENSGIGGVAFIHDNGSSIERGTVDLGGFLQVYNQATADKVTVRNGGRLNVSTGGWVKDVLVQGDKAWDASGKGGVGGLAYILGNGSRLETGTVNQGGFMQVYSEASAGTVTVNNGGMLVVQKQSKIDDVTVNGGYVSTVGRINKATVSKNGDTVGVLDVLDEGTAGAAHINVGGALGVEAGGVAEDVTLDGGSAVTKGRIVKATVNKGGKLDVKAGGKADDVTVKDHGTAYTSGEIVKAVVNSNGVLTVQAGGKAGDVTLRENTGNGGLVVSAGGTVTDITSAGGNAQISGEITGRSTFYGGAVDVNAGGKMANISMNGGSAIVFDQGQITGKSTIDNGGRFGVAPGGKAGDIILNGGPSAINASVVTVAGTAGNITINKKGSLNGAGTVGNVMVHAGGGIFPGAGAGDGMFSPLKATGNVTFDKDSFFSVSIANNGTKADKLDVQGKAELLGGVVQVRAQDIDKETGKLAILSEEQVRKLFQKSFVVLEAKNGVVGKFEKVEQQANYKYITPSLAYDNTTVKLGFELTEAAKNNEAAEKLAAKKQKQDEDDARAAQKAIQDLGNELKLKEAEIDRAKAQKDIDEKQKLTDRNNVAAEAKANEDKIQKLNAELKQKKDEADRLKSEQQAAQKTIQDLGGQLRLKEAEIDRVKAEMQNFKEQVKTQKDVDDTDRAKVATEAKANEDKIQKLNAELKQKQGEADSLKAEKQAAQKTIQKLDGQLKQKQDEAGSLKAEKQKLEEQAKLVTDAKAAEEKAKQEAAALAEAERLKTQLLEERVKNLVLVDAVTPNQKSTGHAVMQLGLGNRLLQTVLFSQKGQALAYDSLSGEAHASLRGTLLQDAGLVSGAASERVRAAFDGVAAKAAPVATPLAYGPEAKDKRNAGEAFDAATPAPVAATTAVWGQAYGGWSHGASDGNAAAYSRNTGGIVTGIDALIAGTWRLGVLAGYGSTSLHGAGSSVSADSYQVGIYGGTRIDALTLSLGTVLAHHEIDTRRTVSFGTLEETDTAGYSANTVQLFGEAAYRIETPYAALEPFAAAAYTHLKTAGFTETGGIAALSAPSSSTDLTTTTLGLRASRAFTLGNATTLTARGMAGWRHAYGDVTPQAQLAFASGGENFDVSGLPVAADAALVEAGLAFDIGRATTLGLTYAGQFSSGVNDNAVKADLTVRF